MADALESLAKVIMDNVSPDSWRDSGGTVGTLSRFGTTLVINQTPANQRDVEKLLEEIRSVGGSGIAAAKADLFVNGKLVTTDPNGPNTFVPSAVLAPVLPATRPAATSQSAR
jgi:hypothetical protein